MGPQSKLLARARPARRRRRRRRRVPRKPTHVSKVLETVFSPSNVSHLCYLFI